uniref:Uncharacterized protein n=2 Tax=Meloidogyne enterolobii TaxID=390850 RepID=A0A6V7Y2R5_MELEN|nr:unnamed protein product [Meloidogyne enterolobii]
MDSHQSGVKNVLKDWPEKYRDIYARVLHGVSSEYPGVAWSRYEEFTYLIPSSIFCSLSCYRLTKSLQSKFDTHNGLSPGHNVRFLVKVDPVGDKDFTVKAYINTTKNDSHLPTDSRFFKVNCVLSDEFPQRCFSKELGEVFLPPRGLNATPIPNVVYEAFVDCKLFIRNDDGSRVSAATQVEIRPELVKLIRVKPLQSKLYSEHVDILRICPWNTKKVESGEIKPQLIYWDYGEEGIVHFYKQNQNKPPFPTRALSKVRLWYFENNRVIRARWPRTQVKITLGMERMIWESISVDIRLRYPPLNEGQFFFGWIIYNEFISCYYVQNYRLSKEGEATQSQLEKRIVIDSGNPVNEYFVRIRESPLFKNLYICDPFENILIADPKFILRNVSLDAHREKGCPVWVRLEPEHERLAHFSISELNKSIGEFSASEKMMSYPNIFGIGLIVDLETNAIFSENHPQKRIFLSNPDIFNIKMGHFFYFSAAYWPLKQVYLIGNYQLISEERRKPIDTYYLGNKLIFEDYFRCYIFQMDDTHMSRNFGPISDSMGLITRKTKTEEEDWPTEGHGYVCFNPDWQAGRSSQFILYSLELDRTAKCVTSSYIQQKELKWWQHQHKDAHELCRCDEIWHLLYSIKQKSEEFFDEEKRENLKNTLKVYQNETCLN